MWYDDAKARKFKVFVEEALERSDDPQNVYTPLALCQEVAGKIPSLDGKILVVSNLEFVYTLVRYFQIDPSRIYYLTPCKIKKQIAESILDPHNIFVYNNEVPTIEDVDNMKFDVVVGNPPYQAAVENHQTRLWMRFIDAAFNVVTTDGFIALITPTNWATTPKLYNKWFAPYKVLHVNMDECARHFSGIGIPFSWYLIQNTERTGELTTFVSKNKIFTEVLPTEPIGSNLDALPILNKMLQSFPKIEEAYAPQTHYSYFAKGRVSRKKSKEFPYKVLLTPSSSNRDARWVWGRSVCDKQTMPRAITTMYPGNWRKMFVSENIQTTHSFIHIPTNTIDEAENMKSFLTSKLITFVVFALNSSRNINPRTIRQLPAVNLSHSWTDEELYEHFGLTDEEIELIENTVK